MQNVVRGLTNDGDVCRGHVIVASVNTVKLLVHVHVIFMWRSAQARRVLSIQEKGGKVEYISV